jgi:Fe-S oxidoreductase
MKRVFAPGCGLTLYKPHLAERLHKALMRSAGPMPAFSTCCRHVPPLEAGTEVVNVCPGCDRRYRENYPDSSTVSAWELLALGSDFPFPDYQGIEMAVLDACPTRTETRVHDAVRELLRRMNVRVVEPQLTRTKGACCGDSLWGNASVEKVKAQMKKRASQMPAADVAVYCVSCAKSMFIGGRRPRYLVDLLFGEETVPQTLEPDRWHAELDEYVASHTAGPQPARNQP